MPFRITDLFSDYLRHQDINDYMDYLQLTYPHLVTVSTVGHSYEQRSIKSIRISSNQWPEITKAHKSFAVIGKTIGTHRSDRSAAPRGPSRVTTVTSGVPSKTARIANTMGIAVNGIRCKTTCNGRRQQKPQQEQQQQPNGTAPTTNSMPLTPMAATARKSIVLIDGGIHAREWATISTAMYCINQLVEHFDSNRKLLLQHDFVIVPIVNVDGYEYSHTKVSEISMESINCFSSVLHVV